jgi:Bax protein
VSLAFAVEPTSDHEPPPDFSVLATDARKQAFFEYLEPLVSSVNASATDDLHFVAHVSEQLRSGDRLSRYEEARLTAVAERYELEVGASGPAAIVDALRSRTGAVPASLVMAQAAKESGWGTSRFAVEGNNFFGQRCYQAGCGLKPRGREEAADWGVARFPSARDSLESYLLNLNTHPSYAEFRRQRQAMRQTHSELSGHELAGALDAYSERGADYVAEVRAMIRQNDLE